MMVFNFLFLAFFLLLPFTCFQCMIFLCLYIDCLIIVRFIMYGMYGVYVSTGISIHLLCVEVFLANNNI